ncbi:MAG: excinuclease ABC subunit UvrC [Gammaproteobacteria bacterium]|nr:excinuclease ABC subunit UvrC [Rhodocyclaceae bacterium]MBU3907897.1 excinuclease ABC subunit UvrC [Gammaproteobacteria bacterium]MBU3988257.1 excinuclease ABC subunit UvrC [Gammaproteobacteria bacterium]MBU4003803.1 excinuclease ABC subunit UvrC [Gammaproteobacteria bacterium]MBU4021681.1 excinuclease ABC subunit UvrC [Gammaproteobacteria bacterium]
MSEAIFDSEAFLATLTDAPGVYRMLAADGAVLYVGKAKNLRKRVSSYFQKAGHSPRIVLMLQQVAAMETTATRSEAEALILENTLIKKLAPKYNILFRDDKSYPYIGLSGGEFPRLFYHRGAFEKKSCYFGPFPSGLAVRESIQLIQKTFLLRTCEEAVFAHRSRPCLMHQIRRCKAPCVGLIAAADYAADVRLAELFLKGRHSEVIDNLTRQMADEAAALHFEQAAVLRDQIKALQAVLHRQYVSSTTDADVDIVVGVVERGELCVNLAMVRGGLHLGDRAYFPQASLAAESAEGLTAFLAQHYVEQPVPSRLILDPWPLQDLPESLHGSPPKNEMERAWLEMALNNARLAVTARRQAKSRASGRLEALRAALDLPEPPHRIECFDISHTMGEGTVASCVVCVDGAMKKGDYRRFNIAGIQPGDDYAAMRQALTRRYEKVATGETVAPDLVLIDGGKGQHGVAREVFAELGLDYLASVGVAKGEERRPGRETLFLHKRAEPLQLAMDNAGFHLIQEIRDEAHRFAIVGHRARRAKVRGRSALEDVAGIGPTRRRKLLAHFGGLDGVKAATVDDLCRVDGISRALAAAIHKQLH